MGSAADWHARVTGLVDQGDAVVLEGRGQQFGRTRHVDGVAVGDADGHVRTPEGADQTEISTVFQAEPFHDAPDQRLLFRVEVVVAHERALVVTGEGGEAENNLSRDTMGEAQHHVLGEGCGTAGVGRDRRCRLDTDYVGTRRVVGGTPCLDVAHLSLTLVDAANELRVSL